MTELERQRKLPSQEEPIGKVLTRHQAVSKVIFQEQQSAFPLG